MKLNQKILKAINEGIRKSLLSFDDVEFEKYSNTIQDANKKSRDLLYAFDKCCIGDKIYIDDVYGINLVTGECIGECVLPKGTMIEDDFMWSSKRVTGNTYFIFNKDLDDVMTWKRANKALSDLSGKYRHKNMICYFSLPSRADLKYMIHNGGLDTLDDNAWYWSGQIYSPLCAPRAGHSDIMLFKKNGQQMWQGLSAKAKVRPFFIVHVDKIQESYNNSLLKQEDIRFDTSEQDIRKITSTGINAHIKEQIQESLRKNVARQTYISVEKVTDEYVILNTKYLLQIDLLFGGPNIALMRVFNEIVNDYDRIPCIMLNEDNVIRVQLKSDNMFDFYMKTLNYMFLENNIAFCNNTMNKFMFFSDENFTVNIEDVPLHFDIPGVYDFKTLSEMDKHPNVNISTFKRTASISIAFNQSAQKFIIKNLKIKNLGLVINTNVIIQDSELQKVVFENAYKTPIFINTKIGAVVVSGVESNIGDMLVSTGLVANRAERFGEYQYYLDELIGIENHDNVSSVLDNLGYPDIYIKSEPDPVTDDFEPSEDDVTIYKLEEWKNVYELKPIAFDDAPAYVFNY